MTSKKNGGMQKIKIEKILKEIMFFVTLLTTDCSTSSDERCEYNMMDMEIKKEYCIPKKSRCWIL